ncbi:IPT/TIG domain-containing protein [Longitalea luteola]|uniref:IPT/TIG domain-containing protein n=1 Tax=Longitalea luteola TaxID=2812563 RepID=UPI001A97B105|nr:IPT/TIG domain-containing protein [Longitalea luteola]
MKKTLACIGSLFIYLGSFSQCLLKELDLDRRINASDLIIEGKVTAQNSFWNDDHTMIYTSNQIEVFKVFKGMVSSDVIDIITEGGIVGLKMITTSSLLSLSTGETGIFFCESVKYAKKLPAVSNGVARYEAYGSKQGFIKYDLQLQEASDPFHKYKDVPNEIYKRISPSLKFTEKKAFTISNNSSNFSTLAAPTPLAVTSFSPTTITAGTGTVLTITGSGFGATQGSGVVQFRNANNGGVSYISPLATQYLSWSDTEIRVEVPTAAGTGDIRVVQGVTYTSASSLTVNYAHLNAIYELSGVLYAGQTQHVNRNGVNGYVWQMNTGFDAHAAARASFLRAFDTWRYGTGINWTLGATTTINVPDIDGVNSICFDNDAPLSPGVLGVCYSSYGGCYMGSDIVWVVDELDIIFDEGSNLAALSSSWEYGTATPAFNEYDFETVAVHELGHGHQLGHVISAGAIMHYNISNGTFNRTLGVNDLAGGNYVQSKSEAAGACGFSAMTPCAGCMVLPMPVAALKAYQKDLGIQVEWSIASEKEIHHYDIEESIDGTAFTAAGSLSPKNNNGVAASYQWFDVEVNSDVNYYRIKTVSISGKAAYSNMIRVRTANSKPICQVYPNPLKGQPLTIEMGNMEKGIYVLNLYNLSGQQVFSRKIVHNGGSAFQTIQLPVTRAGIHRVVLKGNGHALQQTLLIEK